MGLLASTKPARVPAKNVGHVFVYGSLKAGGFFSYGFDQLRLASVPATIRGTMYDLWAFPGVVLEGDGQIHGELHTYRHFSEVVQAFDYIEGYRRGNPESNLYLKKVVEVTTMDGHKKRAIVYTINTQRINLGRYDVVKDGKWSQNL